MNDLAILASAAGQLLRSVLCTALLIMGMLFSAAGQAREPSAAPGVTEQEIILGQSIYLTGPLAELGNDFTSGAAAYFDQINAAGGVYGRKIRVITMDDAYDPKKALANLAVLESKGVFALWQFAGTGTVREVSLVAAEHRIPLIAAIATGPQLRAVLNPYTFYVRAGNSEEIQTIINHLLVSGITRVAAVYVDVPYGQEGLREVQRVMQDRKAQLIATASMKTNGDDALVAAQAMRTADPQAIVMITVPTSSKRFIQAARQLRLRSTMYSLNAGLPIGTMQELGEDGDGVVVAQVMPNVNKIAIPVVREYQRAFRASAHQKFTSASIEGYINAKIMVEALKRAGKQPTREGLIRAIEAMTDYDAGGYRVHFSPANHAGNRAVELSMGSASKSKFIY